MKEVLKFDIKSVRLYFISLKLGLKLFPLEKLTAMTYTSSVLGMTKCHVTGIIHKLFYLATVL